VESTVGAAAHEEALPFHLRGNFAPVMDETVAYDLPIQGAVPRELCGLYVRNGPNPKTGQSPHWFLGDGMLHGVALRNGRALWYRNRWIRTRAFVEDVKAIGPDSARDLTVGLANTHVIAYAGRILALVETSLPTEVTRELETVKCFDFGGRLTTGMTAHPQICPRTGELHFFGYSFMPPFLTYHRTDAGGRLVQSEVIDVPGPTMIHSFAITDRHVVFMDLPVVFDLELAMAGTMPYRWSDEYGARVGVMPRGGTNADVRWAEVTPCYVFHPLNAYEDEHGIVVMDVVRHPELWRAGPPASALAQNSDPRRSEQWTARNQAPACLYRWRIDVRAGRATEDLLDDRAVEFPRVDDRRIGLAHRYGYAVYTERGVDHSTGTALVKYDLRTGSSAVHDFGPGRVPAEPVFVPASSAASEDEGWLMTYVYDAARAGSDLVILDAGSFTGKPVATISLPQRVPFGFHGSWIPEA
jgi:carotenoid cleavage dioxygenase-like enzyme